MSTAAKSAIEGTSKLPPAPSCGPWRPNLCHTKRWRGPRKRKPRMLRDRLPGLRLGSCEWDRAAWLRGWSRPFNAVPRAALHHFSGEATKRAVHGVLNLGHCPRLPHAGAIPLAITADAFLVLGSPARRTELRPTAFLGHLDGFHAFLAFGNFMPTGMQFPVILCARRRVLGG
jgi:hypothetical protein